MILGFLSTGGGVVNLFSKWIKDSKITKHETMLADHESKINKLENATVSSLGTRLKALETKTVEEPTESEVTE